MTIASRLEEIKTAKQNIKSAIESELGQDLSEVAFVNYHEYIKSSGGYYAPSLNITFEEKTEYVVGTEVTFSGVTKTLDGSMVLTGVPITYNGSVVVTSGSDGSWSYTTTWVSGGCTFTVVDSTYGIVCKERAYPHDKFFDSFTNLQTLVNALSDGETLILDCNYRYLETSTGNGVTIGTSNITLDGQGKYVLDGNSLSRIINIGDSTVSGVSLKGLTFKNGKVESDYGAGIYNAGADLSVSDCTFTNNTSTRGGGIYNRGADLSVSDCTFTNNTVDISGGGIYNDGADLSVSDCTFTNNTTSDSGGGIFNNGDNANADNCYWGTNTPTFDDTIVYGVTINTYYIIEITTISGYIKLQSKQYNPTTSTTSTHRTPLSNVEATITVGGNTYKKTLRNGILRQAYTAPATPYDITVQLASGEVVTKTIEA